MRLPPTVVRTALWSLRRAVSVVGYDIVPLPKSTDPRSKIQTMKVLPKLDKDSGVPIPSRALRSFPTSEGHRVFLAYSDIRARILNLDGSQFDFVLFDRDDEGIQSLLLSYINVSRIANYLTYIDFLKTCNISLDGRKCLDLGTAFGVFPHLISQVYKDSEVYGIDVDETYISISRALFPDGNYASGKLEELSASTKYDTVFCTQTLEHMIFPARSVQSLLSLVSSGGHLILTVPDGRSDLSPSAALRAGSQSYIGHVNFWSIESWASFLSENFEFRHAEVAITDRRTLYACIQVS